MVFIGISKPQTNISTKSNGTHIGDFRLSKYSKYLNNDINRERAGISLLPFWVSPVDLEQLNHDLGARKIYLLSRRIHRFIKIVSAFQFQCAFMCVCLIECASSAQPCEITFVVEVADFG